MAQNPFACLGLSAAAALFALNLAPGGTLAVLIASAVCLAVCLLVRRLPGRSRTALLLFGVMAAAVLFSAAQKAAWEPALAMDRRTAAIRGEATGEASVAEVSEGELGYFSVIRTDGGQRVMLVSADDPALRPGDRVSFEGKLYAAQPWQNRADRVFLTCWYPQNVAVRRAERIRVRDWPYYTRRFLIERITGRVGGEAGAVAAAMVTGEKETLAGKTYLAFQKAGVVHIAAVSGLHMNLIVLTLYRLLRRLFVTKRRSCAAVCIAAAWAYAAAADLTPSAVRACVVITALLGGVLFGRRISPLNSLGLAAFVILLVDPYAVCSLSFELSFAAALGLLLIGRNLLALDPFAGIKRKLPRRILTAVYTALAVTLSASVGCLPVYPFAGINATVACFAGNLTTFFAVAPSLVTGLLAALPGAFGRLSARLCRLCTGYILFAVRLVSRREWFPLFSRQSALIAAAVFLLGFLVSACRKRIRKKKAEPVTK